MQIKYATNNTHINDHIRVKDKVNLSKQNKLNLKY